MKDLVVTAGEVKITSNLGEIKEQALEIAKEYDVAVTVDNIKEAKALSTELNKMKATIKDVVKENLAVLNAPINALKLEAKEVDTILEDARQKLVQGVEVFNDARRLEHKQKLEDFFTFRLKEENLGAIVNTGVAHLVTLTGLTASGELNKKSKDDVEAVVSKIKTEALEAKLEKERQEKADEERIAKEVEERLEKQREIDKKALEEKHAKELEDAKKTTVNKEPVAEPAKEETTPPPATTQEPTPEKSIYKIDYSFEVKAKAGANPEDILARVASMFLREGVTPVSTKCLEIVYES